MSKQNGAAALNNTADETFNTSNENPAGSTKATPEILAGVEFEKHRGSWDWRTVTAPPDLVATLDDEERITISEVTGGVRSSRCEDTIMKRGSFRKKYLHTRADGPKHGPAFRYAATNAPGLPFEDWKTKRGDGLEYIQGFYADFDVEWVAEAFAAIERANELGIATDAHFTGSLGAETSGVGSGVVHKHAGLIDDKGRTLPYKKTVDGVEQMTRATPVQVVAARRAEKPWHPAFAATIECVVDEQGDPVVNETVETRKNDDGTDTTFTLYEYQVRHAPRIPLRVWFHFSERVPAKTEEERRRLAKMIARCLQLIGAPPYDKCGFNPNQPIFPNRGPVRPTLAHVVDLPEALTFNNDGERAYISGKGTGAINPGALDALPEPDTPTWLGSKSATNGKGGSRKSGANSFVAQDDFDELGILLMNSKAVRHGFMAAHMMAHVAEFTHEAASGKTETDCFTDEHNAAGRKQMFAKDGDPTAGVWPAFGCRDDNCTVCDQGALNNTARLAWLIGCALKYQYITLEELPDFFADEVSKEAAARIIAEWSNAGSSGDDFATALEGLPVNPTAAELTALAEIIGACDDELAREERIEAVCLKTNRKGARRRTFIQAVKGARKKQLDARTSGNLPCEFAAYYNEKGHAAIKAGNTVCVLWPASCDDDAPSFVSLMHFHNYYANRRAWVNGDYRATSQLWWQSPERPTYDAVVNKPYGMGQSDPTGDAVYNLFGGWAVEPRAGVCARFEEHIRAVICAGDEKHYEWLMSWLAQLLSDPANKPGTVIVLRSKKGTGKSMFAKFIKRLFKKWNALTISKKEQLLGKHNKHLAQAVLVVVEEALFAGEKSNDGVLKDLATGDTQLIEPKGVDAFEVENHLHLIMLTNEKWAVPATGDERRYFVLDVSDAHVGDASYFDALVREMENGGLEAFAAKLLNWQTPEWVNLRKPPHTQALNEQVQQGWSSAVKWLHHVLETGVLQTDTTKYALIADEGAMFDGVDAITKGVPKPDVMKAYEVFHAKLPKKDYPFDKTQIGKLLAEIGVESEERREGEKRSRGRREHFWKFPALKVARVAFTNEHKGTFDSDLID